jgi:hypothetical protein
MDCPKHDDCRATPEAVMEWMLGELLDGNHVDPATGIADLTGLAEGAAAKFDHDEWLDDEQAAVWELASAAATETGHGDHP